MLSIDEYIACRKQEDNLKDFDLDTRDKNVGICVNYVFEYFNDYLPQHEKKAKIYMDNEKIEKYRSRLQSFSPDVKTWLVDLYSKHYNLINFTLKHLIDKKEFFLLCYSEKDFENIAIDCLTKLARKYPYIRDEKDGVLLFIKDYHRIDNNIFHDDKIPKLPQSIDNWINDTMLKYHVGLKAFAFNWCYNVMFDNTIPKPTIPKSVIDYEDFQNDILNKENLFDIDHLYNQICNKPFIINKKQELLLLIIYYWSTYFKDTDIWETYMKIYNNQN
jgi:hypothetical protein